MATSRNGCQKNMSFSGMFTILFILIMSVGPSCAFMQGWMTGTLFTPERTVEDIKREHTFCRECGSGIPEPRGSSQLVRVERETVVNPTPMINYGPTLAESTVLGEGYHFPRTRREVQYVRVPCEPRPGGSAHDFDGKGPFDLCLVCYIDQLQAKRKAKREARLARTDQNHLDRTREAYRKMLAWVLGE